MEENSVGVLDLPNRANLLSSLTILALRFASSLAHPEVTCKAMSRSVTDTLSSIMKSFPGWTPGNQWVFIMPKNCDLGQTLVTFAVPWLRWRPVVWETAMVHGWRRGRGDPERHGRLFQIKVLFKVLLYRCQLDIAAYTNLKPQRPPTSVNKLRDQSAEPIEPQLCILQITDSHAIK